MPTPVSPGQAAPALGVNETSVKRWCDMGLLEPMRTTGGHRRIAHAEVVRFARASESPLVRPELVGLPSASTAGPVARERALKEALEALKNDEEKQLVALVAHLFGAGRSAPDICVRVLAPALHELGSRWQHGDVESYEERRACEIVQAALYEPGHLLPAPPRSAPRALGGTLEADPYMRSSSMCALVLRELGWRAENLGAGLPTEQPARRPPDASPRSCGLACRAGLTPRSSSGPCLRWRKPRAVAERARARRGGRCRRGPSWDAALRAARGPLALAPRPTALQSHGLATDSGSRHPTARRTAPGLREGPCRRGGRFERRLWADIGLKRSIGRTNPG